MRSHPVTEPVTHCKWALPGSDAFGTSCKGSEATKLPRGRPSSTLGDWRLLTNTKLPRELGMVQNSETCIGL